MDIEIEGALKNYQLVRSSILATNSEVERAAHLMSRVEEGSQVAAVELQYLSDSLVARETARPHVISLPKNIEQLAPVVSGLEGFVREVKAELELHAAEAKGRRRLWVFLSLVSMLSPLGYFMTLGFTRYVEGAFPWYGILAACLFVGVSVLCFRVYSQSDETLRRLNEKLVALSFLKSSISLVRSVGEETSYVEDVLRQGFGLFLSHYEGQAAPVAARDLVGGFLSQ